MSKEAEDALSQIKIEIEGAVMKVIDKEVPFQVETDASDNPIATVLTQKDRPVAFYSRTFQGSKKRHASMEKETQAIIHAVRHYLSSRHFRS